MSLINPNIKTNKQNEKSEFVEKNTALKTLTKLKAVTLKQTAEIRQPVTQQVIDGMPLKATTHRQITQLHQE
ncbi:MAG TPA: hypothetical protein PK289_08015 [Bacteroidia bacterium]|nr:hypothetical protein [Bacteroidia bacterium]HRG52585.1 hypothetical protein [Bacteroidia bacterium]